MTVETPPVETPPTETAPPATPPAEEPTALEKAIKAERERADKAEKALKAREAADEKARIAALDDNARAIEEAKAAAKAEVAAEYEGRLLKARVQAQASAFHDPALVAGLLELTPEASDEDIAKALGELATAKPYLVKTGNGLPPMPQGPRGTGSGQAGESGDDWLRQMVQAKQQG